ncbi:hypothetical protein SLOPH_2348 [Spraguea lophii 42_110]|uniref:Uncharacterized protein n=1 Tax=Spraguea lophii (strain 42_110) TaxID=1358809 RepID=S7W5S5_SPRLO|nr:hypothetical protein SLOPH_2348 [Spraguea lophii 42_110]
MNINTVFRNDIRLFDKICYTDNGIPLPIDDNEEILFYSERASFFIKIGNGIPAFTITYSSGYGKLFLTNYRLVYKPEIERESFKSFSTSLASIVHIDKSGNMELLVSSDTIGDIIVGFDDSQRSIFVSVMNLALENYEVKTFFPENKMDEDEKDLPYYCEVYKH